MATVELRNVGKQFDAVQVLQNIDFEVPKSEFLVLDGPSGCGKSTLLWVTAGRTEPSRTTRLSAPIASPIRRRRRAKSPGFHASAPIKSDDVVYNNGHRLEAAVRIAT